MGRPLREDGSHDGPTPADDDVEAPSVKLELPARLILEDAPRVVRWAIRDPSGLGQAEVDVAAPDGYGETIKRAVGEIDFGNRGPGGYSFFVKAIDDDRDRPGDAAGTPALHTFFVANDRDGDGVLSNADNCPNVANPDQADRNSDGFGDVCDPCPGRNGPQPDADGMAWATLRQLPRPSEHRPAKHGRRPARRRVRRRRRQR